MEESDFILGLFFSDENNLIYDNIKLSEELPEENKNRLKMLSYKFLGPIFLTSAERSEEGWKIDFIEASLSLKKGLTRNVDILQSFFNINSTLCSEEGLPTHISALIGSPHTEDVKILHDKLVQYIHPVILQGKLVLESVLGSDFKFSDFIKKELKRGINLLEFSLGKARKMYWEEQQQYYCLGIIERVIERGIKKTSNLYTFNKDDPLRKLSLDFIPSFYTIAILPDYYESLINETLELFNRKSIFSNISVIELSNQNKNIFYFEEFNVENDIKKSYGAILVPNFGIPDEAKNISFYRRNLRNILDLNKDDPFEIIVKINPNFKSDKWCTKSEEDLTKISECFDKKV